MSDIVASWLTVPLSISLLCLSAVSLSHPHTLSPLCESHLCLSHLHSLISPPPPPPGRSRWTFTTGTEMGGKCSRSLLSFFFFFIHFQLQIESLECHTLFCQEAVLLGLLLGIRTDGVLHPPGTCWLINQKHLAGERWQLSGQEVRVYERWPQHRHSFSFSLTVGTVRAPLTDLWA